MADSQILGSIMLFFAGLFLWICLWICIGNKLEENYGINALSVEFIGGIFLPLLIIGLILVL